MPYRGLVFTSGINSGNYSAVLRDTSNILTANPAISKAYYRAASALLATNRWDAALDCIARGSALPEEGEPEKQQVWVRLREAASRGLQKEADRAERERRKRVGAEALRRALRVSAGYAKSPPTRC